MPLDDATKDKVRRQVDFYFSESNLPRDKFLKEKVESDPEGYVDIALLCTFSRMAGLLKSSYGAPEKVPPTRVAEVADALDGSDTVALSEDRRRVRRAQPLGSSEEVAKEVDARSLYASPFPFDATLDKLTEFFERSGSVRCVRMRRHLSSKDFRGSVFVEFASPEEAAKVLGLPLEYEGAPLTLEPKAEFTRRKAEGREERAAAGAAAAAAAGGRGGGQKRKADGEPEAAEAAAAAGADAAAAPAFDPGCVLRFDFGAGTEFSDAVTFGLVKDSLGGREGGVKYVEYEEGAKSGHARFETAEQAAAAAARAEGGKALVAGYEAALEVLQGEEEVQYHKKAAAARAERQTGGGRGGRGGWRGGGRRGGGRGSGGRGGKRGRR